MFLKIPKEKSRIQSPSIPLLPETEWIAKTRTVYMTVRLNAKKDALFTRTFGQPA